ncbi:MAG TPA: peptide chain release factor-like protein [Opitutaceae bacterium]|jgi:protein subunit release factor B|nr:peptide chain release factor-like protein [Opitutaceae bacterium]
MQHMADGFSQLDEILQRRLAALGVRAEDVEEKFIRGAGPGGQKINKTSSTVWLRHMATGVEVRMQRERSQVANRMLAWAGLCEKLEARRHAATAAAVHARELARRRGRQRSRTQKAIMVGTKRRHSRHKANRGRVEAE